MSTRRGRPPLDPTDPSVAIGLRVPAKSYDDLWARAQAEHVSVPELIRRELQRKKISKLDRLMK